MMGSDFNRTRSTKCPSLSQSEAHRAMNSALTPQNITPETVSPGVTRLWCGGRAPQVLVSGCTVTFNISIFKQVVRVDYQVGVFLIAFAFFGGAFQSSLGKLNQNVIVVR